MGDGEKYGDRRQWGGELRHICQWRGERKRIRRRHTDPGHRNFEELQYGLSGTIGGGILCLDSSPTILKYRIVYNSRKLNQPGPDVRHGGGIALLGNCQGTISRCVIADNWVELYGAGIVIRSDDPEQESLVITHCTIANNRSFDLWSRGMDVDCWDTQPTITNSIIWTKFESSLVIADPARVSYSCVSEALLFTG